MPPPLQAVGDRFLSMNHVADDAPCGQEHIKDSDQHDQALSIAHRKQRRINPDVIRAVYKRDNRDIERSRAGTFQMNVTLGE